AVLLSGRDRVQPLRSGLDRSPHRGAPACGEPCARIVTGGGRLVTWLPWILVLGLGVAVGWLLLALHGADRTIADLREAAEDVLHLSSGIAAGRRAPWFEGAAVDGGRF